MISAILTVSWALTTCAQAQGLPEEQEAFSYAQRLLDDRLYDSAADEFRQFILNYPTSERIAQGRLRLGDAYYGADAFEAAADAYQLFVDRHPQSLEVATALRNRARALQQLGDHRRAAVAFQDLHDRFPAGEYAPQDLLSAGANYESDGDLVSAEAAFRTLLTRHPGSPLIHEAGYSLGRTLVAQGRTDEALRQLRTVRDSEREPDALLEIGRVYLVRGDLPQATSVLDDLRGRFPRSRAAENAYLILAGWHADQGEWEQAARTYEDARQALPKNERRQRAVLGLADARRRLGEDARALYAEFITAYPESPFLPEARLGLARAYADRSDFRSALDAFKRLQESFPDHPLSIASYRDEGDIWRDLGAPRKALAAYRRNSEGVVDPAERSEASLRIARLYEQDLTWYDRAEALYRQLAEPGAASGTPEAVAAEAQFGLGRTYESWKRPVLAVREYRTYLERFPGEPRAEEAERRIRLIEEFGAASSGANDDFLELLDALSDRPEVRFEIGRRLAERGRYEDAAARLAEAARDTTFPQADEALYRLGNTHARLAEKADLERDATARTAHAQSSATAFRRLQARSPESEWADDAAFGLIEAAVDLDAADSSRARRMLEAYGGFLEQYPRSDRREEALLRIADAHLLAGRTAPARLSDALEAYRKVSDPALAERADFGIALSLSLRREYVQAEEALRDFQFRHPTSRLGARAQFQLGWILLQRGFVRSASEEFAALLLAPSSLAIDKASRNLLAECYFQLEDYPRAIAIDEGLVDRDPTPVVLSRLAQAYRQTRQPAKALAIYADFVRRFPESSAADSMAYSRAELLADLDRREAAIAALEAFSRDYPRSALQADARKALVGILFESGDFAECLKALAGIPENARDETTAAREVVSLYRLDRVKEAERARGIFRKRFPGARDERARFEVEEGVQLLRAGKPGDARKRFEAVIKDFAGSAVVGDAQFHLVAALRVENKAEEHFAALLAFIKTHEDNSHWPAANLELAALYEKDDDYTGAARAYRNALQAGVASEKRPELLQKLANAYANLRLYDSAIEYTRTLVNQYPKHTLAANARVRIGELLHEKGDHEGAIRELTPQLKDLQGDEWSSAQFTIAESHKALGDFDAALREYLKMIYNHQGTVYWLASAHMGRAVAFEAQGRDREAIDELNKVIARFGPTSQYGIHAAEKIRQLEVGLN